MKEAELLSLNRRIKRRLQLVDEGKSSFYIDSVGRKVNDASLMGLDNLTIPDPALYRSEFTLSDILDLRGSQKLTRLEVEKLFGHDYKTVSEDLDILAMLEALRGGMGGSRTNAYLLGPTINQAGVARIPVAYFIIPQKRHSGLSSS